MVDEVNMLETNTFSTRISVESGRYANTITRKERRSHFSNKNDIGDAYHYCMISPHNDFSKVKNSSLQNLSLINSNFESFNKKSLFRYLVCMADKNYITNVVASHFFKVFKIFSALRSLFSLSGVFG